jgi:hypothetical protein
MRHRTLLDHYCLTAALLVFVFGAQPANATNASISGSYEVLRETGLGSQEKVLVRFHLTNHGQGPLYLQEVLLSDFAHPSSGGSLTTSITLHPGTSAETSQEFVIPRLQYDQWQKGLHPRAILELKTAKGARITQAIRLERVPARKGE